MPDMTDDPELLRRYAEAKSEAAFAELVRRHLGFVFALALRRTAGDTHLAEQAALQVFTWLAREAVTLENQPLLSGWLYRRTRTAAETVLRADRRRQRRDAATAGGEAAAQEWSRLGPVIDESLEQLGELDGEALLLRVVRQQTWEEVAARLSLAEPAARMRVERSIGRVQAALADRGIALTPGAVEQFLARGANHPVPPALYPQITNAALEAATAALARSRPVGAGPAARWLAVAAAVVAVLAVAAAIHETVAARRAGAELAAAQRQVETLTAEARGLRERLQAEGRRTQAADEDNARLLEAVTSIAAAMPAAETPPADTVTAETVRGRFKRAGELARSRRYAEALQDYLWCYDEGMARVGALRGVRRTLVTRAIAELGRQFPPAMQALRSRRDAAEAAMRTSPEDHDAANDFAELNEALGESSRTLAEFDAIPADDPRRSTLVGRVRDELAAAGRYREAAQARPYWQMNSEFETLVAGAGSGAAAAPAARQELHDSIVRSGVADVEVLAGSGDAAHARTLARRLLAFDDSEETRALLRQRLERAGQPELLEGLVRR